MAKSGKGYLNLGLVWIINVILAIIPVTSWLLGGITRIMRGHWIMGILQLLLIGEVVFLDRRYGHGHPFGRFARVRVKAAQGAAAQSLPKIFDKFPPNAYN